MARRIAAIAVVIVGLVGLGTVPAYAAPTAATGNIYWPDHEGSIYWPDRAGH